MRCILSFFGCSRSPFGYHMAVPSIGLVAIYMHACHGMGHLCCPPPNAGALHGKTTIVSLHREQAPEREPLAPHEVKHWAKEHWSH